MWWLDVRGRSDMMIGQKVTQRADKMWSFEACLAAPIWVCPIAMTLHSKCNWNSIRAILETFQVYIFFKKWSNNKKNTKYVWQFLGGDKNLFLRLLCLCKAPSTLMSLMFFPWFLYYFLYEYFSTNFQQAKDKANQSYD